MRGSAVAMSSNRAFDADTQQQNAAARQLPRAGGLERYTAHAHS